MNDVWPATVSISPRPVRHADLLRRLDRYDDAAAAYRRASS